MLLFKLILFLTFLLLSGFFSASETALFSLDSIKIRRLSKEGKDASSVIRLIENPLKCLTVILAGNTLVNIALSALITSILIDFLGPKGLGFAIGVATLILLVFGEVTPKTIAIHNNEKVSGWFSGPLYKFSRLISPFVIVASKVSDRIIALLRLNFKKEPTLTEEEFKTIIEVGHRYGVVGKSEKEMIVSILELTTTMAQEVMTPRTDIKAISSEMSQEEALEYARQCKHSKIPIYGESLDNVSGIVYAKQLFLNEVIPFNTLSRPAIFVPPTKKIAELLADFYKQKIKIAIVVDEHGGTSGLVTLEDILEEVFGEIYDEFEAAEKLVEVIRPGVFRVSGKAPLYKVNEDCQIELIPGEYETIAGFLLDLAGKIPAGGERMETSQAAFTVEKVVGRRIKSVLLEKKSS